MKKKIYKIMGVALIVVLLGSLTIGLAVPAAADPGKLKWTELDLPKMGGEGDYVLTPCIDLGPIATSPEGEALFAAKAKAIAVYGGFYIDDGEFTIVADTGDVTGTIEGWLEGYAYGWSGEFTATADYDYEYGDYDGTFVISGHVCDNMLTFSGTVEAEDGDTVLSGTYTIDDDDYVEIADDGELYGTLDTDVGDFDLDNGTYVSPLLFKSTDGGESWKAMDGFWDTATDQGDYTLVVDTVVSPDYADDETLFVATLHYVYQSVDGGETFAALPNPWYDDDSEIIFDLDVAMDERGRLSIMVGTRGFIGGDVYVYGSKTLTWVDQNVDSTAADNCADDDFDVLAVGFSPFYADDELITAVVTDGGLTQVWFAVTPTTDPEIPAGWGATYGIGRIRGAEDETFGSWWARIAFPDDFDAGGIGNNVCFVALAAGATGSGYADGTELGDVYKVSLKEATFSSAVDLDIRGVVTTLLPTATNIMSIDVAGEAEDCSILVGTDYTSVASTPTCWLVYRSDDGGETWIPSGTKSPTGGEYEVPYTSWTKVLMSHDFLTSDTAYAATWGDGTSGFSRSTDGGASWNQISLIDYGDPIDGYIIPGSGATFTAAGYNADDMLHMVTAETVYASGPFEGKTETGGAVWQSSNGGENWERIWSYANPGVTPTIQEVFRVGDETIFAVDLETCTAWRSSDMGASWPKKITTKKPATGEILTEFKFVSETEVWTGFSDGKLWWSTNSGTTWDKPEENPMTSPIGIIVVMGDIILTSNVGGAYFSSDGAETFERIGKPGEPMAGEMCLTLPDLGFADNNMVYSVPVAVLDGGVWRAEVDFDDPSDSEWERIDDSTLQPVTDPDYNPATVFPTSPAIALPPSGLLYVTDLNDGLWRSTNPTADVDGAHPPYFEKESKGLAGGTALLDLDVFPTVLFCINAAAVPYYEQVVMFTDTLDSGVTLADPGDAATGVGLLPAGRTYPKVKLAWEEMAGATSYQWQIAIDSGFKSMEDSDFTTSLVSKALTLSPNKTYYWRVRVADEGSLIGAPLISPWSATWKFKTAIGATMARPDLEAPWAGEPDVALSPTFEWSGIEWAETYEFELSTGSSTTAGGYFTDVLVGLIGTNALVSTAWKCDIALDYETRYYWHVKAFGVDTETPWSDVGTFTTMGVAPAPPEPAPPVVIPPVEEITPIWLWVIIGIGAALMIAVIILIVTTRRVP